MTVTRVPGHVAEVIAGTLSPQTAKLVGDLASGMPNVYGDSYAQAMPKTVTVDLNGTGKKAEWRHHNNKAGECATCHTNPKGGKELKKIDDPKEALHKLCIGCHKEHNEKNPDTTKTPTTCKKTCHE